jgi:hypothetical protein
VPAASRLGGGGGGTVSGAGAEQARTPQDLGRRVGEVRQVVEGFLADEVVTVGVADGERQPQHPADPALPFWAVVALGGVGGGRGLDQGVVAQVATADPSRVRVGELARQPEEDLLAPQGWWADLQVVGWLGCGAGPFDP